MGPISTHRPSIMATLGRVRNYRSKKTRLSPRSKTQTWTLLFSMPIVSWGSIDLRRLTLDFCIWQTSTDRLLVFWWQIESLILSYTENSWSFFVSFRLETVLTQGYLEGLPILFALGSSIFWVAGLLKFDSHEMYLPVINVPSGRKGAVLTWDFPASPSLESKWINFKSELVALW